ncbi:type IV secretion/conjugal transfer ATPase, VirB4 family [Escherichia coli]|uniref:Type IV secretion/conjugal transfer ATPase, VirB4 family n=1 Tax=Escherichia coli TaxID=562 RepID=A0A377BER6_ECOLX|nr:type IV secretion/conjugal transfer ATPase, VirB4 family [Escherichia coli]
MMETGDRSQSQLEQLNTALDLLLSKEIVMGYHHATIHVFDTDQRAVAAQGPQS